MTDERSSSFTNAHLSFIHDISKLSHFQHIYIALTLSRRRKTSSILLGLTPGDFTGLRASCHLERVNNIFNIWWLPLRSHERRNRALVCHSSMVRASYRSSEGCGFYPRLGLRYRFFEVRIRRTFICQSFKIPPISYVSNNISVSTKKENNIHVTSSWLQNIKQMWYRLPEITSVRRVKLLFKLFESW